jgi:hypothetical protein
MTIYRTLKLHGFPTVVAVGWMVLLRPAPAYSESPIPSCPNPFGSSAARRAIEQAMYQGSEADVIAAINAAKTEKGNQVGCSEESYSHRTPLLDTPPSFQQALAKWQIHHAAPLAAYQIDCPALVGQTMGWAFRGGIGEFPQVATSLSLRVSATTPIFPALPDASGRPQSSGFACTASDERTGASRWMPKT